MRNRTRSVAVSPGVNDDDDGAVQKQQTTGECRRRAVHLASQNSEPTARADVGAAAHFAEHLASTAGHCAAARKQGGRRVTSHGRGDAGRCSTASAAARHGELEELLFLGVHGRGKMQGCRERNSPRGGAARGRDVQSMGDRTHGGGRPSIWERGVQRHGGRGKLATMGVESSCWFSMEGERRPAAVVGGERGELGMAAPCAMLHWRRQQGRRSTPWRAPAHIGEKDPCTERRGEEGRWAEVPRRECGAMDREQRYPRPWSRKGARPPLELGARLHACSRVPAEQRRRELCVRGKKGEERVAARGREW
jgi:hypothetical protein